MQKLEPGPVKEIPEQPELVRLWAACEGALQFASKAAASELRMALSWKASPVPELERICRAGAVVLAELEGVGVADEPPVVELRAALERFMRLPPKAEHA